MASIPKAHIGQVIGLLEVLEDFDGRVDVAKVADDLMLELDDLLPAVDTAELLGFVKVDSGDLVLTEEGKRFLSKGSAGRKKILNKLIPNLGVYKRVMDYMSSRNGEVSREDLLNLLRVEMPNEDAETVFHWLIEWGRHSLILRYDNNTNKVRLVKSGENCGQGNSVHKV